MCRSFSRLSSVNRAEITTDRSSSAENHSSGISAVGEHDSTQQQQDNVERYVKLK
eukprot:m.173207 g.173207  ORF g.173207 m.173207 type:complete len:55 (-) comp14583_c0_seq7:1288-1452(-)